MVAKIPGGHISSRDQFFFFLGGAQTTNPAPLEHGVPSPRPASNDYGRAWNRMYLPLLMLVTQCQLPPAEPPVRKGSGTKAISRGEGSRVGGANLWGRPGPAAHMGSPSGSLPATHLLVLLPS